MLIIVRLSWGWTEPSAVPKRCGARSSTPIVPVPRCPGAPVPRWSRCTRGRPATRPDGVASGYSIDWETLEDEQQELLVTRVDAGRALPYVRRSPSPAESGGVHDAGDSG